MFKVYLLGCAYKRMNKKEVLESIRAKFGKKKRKGPMDEETKRKIKHAHKKRIAELRRKEDQKEMREKGLSFDSDRDVTEQIWNWMNIR